MASSGFFDDINSWSDFSARLVTLSESDRGATFEQIVRHYLATTPLYRAKLAHVWLRADIPAEIQSRLHLPPRDMGIDLVAQTHAGEFWAIQAKYRSDSDASLTFAELSTFSSLAFHVCRGAFAYALVCTTTARIPGILRNLPNLGDLTNETWTALGPDFFTSLRDSLTALAPPPLRASTPFGHQRRAVANALAHFRDRGESRGKLISPCGSGKSLTAYWIVHELGARRVLIAVPSLALVRQTLEKWMTETIATGSPADWLCVCSDEQVASFDNDTLNTHVHELGIPCDTNADELAAHLSVARERPGLLVVLTTYQSSPVLAAAARSSGFAFDFAIFDEAHKTTGRAAGSFAHLLFDENLPLPRRLFMTATERRFQGRSDEVVSMDDESVYGKTFELLTFKAATAASPPILSDYRILTIGVRESEVAALVEANRWLDLRADGLNEVTAQALASIVALRRATSAHGVRHTVSFHSSIARAKQFRDLCAKLNAALPGEPAIAAHHVNGRMGSAVRQQELDRFIAAAPSLVTNARCLTEGVDVPGIDCVFFADPKGSTIEIVQAAGRALRLAEGKKLGYILLPLVVRDGATLDEVAASSAFKFVLFVLRALATHDERIVEWFRATAEGRTPEVGRLVHFDFGNVVTSLGVSAPEFAKQIEVKCWATIAKLSFATYEQAQTWARKLQLTSGRAWGATYRKMTDAGTWPADIPRAVDFYYRSRGWVDWPTFLGVGRKYVSYVKGRAGRRFRPFADARVWAQNLGLRSLDDWMSFVRKDPVSFPTDIPSWPDRTYRNSGWSGWTDFLGYSEDWRSFPEARQFARSLKFSGQREWKRFAKGARPDLPPKPSDIPASPWKAYEKRGWAGWRDWLGTTKPIRAKPAPANPTKPRAPRKRRSSRFRDFESARAFARSLQLKSSTEWYGYLHGARPEKGEKPDDIPSSPNHVYSDNWLGWGDWLGTGNVAPFRKVFRPFAEARAFARTLGLRTSEDWDRWGRMPGNRPLDIPSRPEVAYRDQGWISYADFLQATKDSESPSAST
ncbi:MAG TPA: DEAD/DEAH box helicase family protein [Opitutus sp.]|nr:DEAD/DEAH box helicase family protein [Opitutus sp.]